MARFQLLTPCPRKSGSVRGCVAELPPQSRIVDGSPATNPALGTLKQLVLNHLFSRSTADPSIFLSQFGSTFGRNPYPDPIRLGVAVNPSGKPACKRGDAVQGPSADQHPQNPGRPAPEPLAFAERQIQNVVDDEPVPGIEAAQRHLRLKDCWSGTLRPAGPEFSSQPVTVSTLP